MTLKVKFEAPVGVSGPAGNKVVWSEGVSFLHMCFECLLRIIQPNYCILAMSAKQV